MKINLIVTIAKLIIKQVSPKLREEIEKIVNSLEVKAGETKNPYDDILVQLVKTLLDM